MILESSRTKYSGKGQNADIVNINRTKKKTKTTKEKTLRKTDDIRGKTKGVQKHESVWGEI